MLHTWNALHSACFSPKYYIPSSNLLNLITHVRHGGPSGARSSLVTHFLHFRLPWTRLNLCRPIGTLWPFDLICCWCCTAFTHGNMSCRKTSIWFWPSVHFATSFPPQSIIRFLFLLLRRIVKLNSVPERQGFCWPINNGC